MVLVAISLLAVRSVDSAGWQISIVVVVLIATAHFIYVNKKSSSKEKAG